MARLLYFGSLPDRLERAEEDVALPDAVNDVGGLLEWLRTRGGNWEQMLVEGAVQVTVNKQFAEQDTPIGDDDEIAIVSVGLM